MTTLIYITHPDVIQEPAVPVPLWALSARGRARMTALLAQPWVPTVTAVYSSAERKALDGAAILAGHLGLTSTTVAELGEVDRSSTGFLPGEEHAALARTLMEQPDVSAGGWETARQAQQRVVRAVERILSQAQPEDAIAIVGHGGVGTLLLCHLTGRPIRLSERPPGPDGGYFFIYDATGARLVAGWERMDDSRPTEMR
jgi:broad specificity phosphatase PhoE